MTRVIALLLMSCILCPASATTPLTLLLTPDTELVNQRIKFSAAREAIKQGRTTEAKRLKAQLENYPLYPYLEYWSLSRRLSRAQASDIFRFDKAYSDTPLARRLRHNWLLNTAKQGRWQVLAEHYVASNDAKLECYYRRALYKTGQQAEALKNMSALWLVGHSQPSACDPLFSAWQDTPAFTSDLAWQRIQLAMAKNESYLVRYLERFVSPEKQRQAELWRQAHRQPEQALKNKALKQDLPWIRETLGHGIKRLSRRQASKAGQAWVKLAKQYNFSLQQRQDIERTIALRLAKQNAPEALDWLTKLPESDKTVREWRVLSAMNQRDWDQVLFWIDALPTAEKKAERWQYWRARALEQNNHNSQAHSAYQQLAGKRHYYGFLAADRINSPYRFQHLALEVDSTTLTEVGQRADIIRARELYALGDSSNARREWYAATRNMDNEQAKAAAKLAHSWGWHDRTISTLSSTPYRDDIELRFPLVHTDTVKRHSETNNIDPAWAYAVIRQESAFTADARSPKGALGLMQIMPKTGQFIAKGLGTYLSHNYQLLDINTNIRFGTHYLRKVLGRFDDNTVLATAAYNAGSSRVKRWLPEDEAMAADLWIEAIPFRETQNYLKNVLAYTVVYEQRLNQKAVPLKLRMPVIPAKSR